MQYFVICPRLLCIVVGNVKLHYVHCLSVNSETAMLSSNALYHTDCSEQCLAHIVRVQCFSSSLCIAVSLEADVVLIVAVVY